MLHTTSAAPAIVSVSPARHHLDTDRVDTEPHRRTFAGVEFEVTYYWRNGQYAMASGYKIKKDGTPYARRTLQPMRWSSVPANVAAAFDTMAGSS